MTNQNQLVLNHLIDHGYITQTIASNYGVRRLAARIHELRIKNVQVDVERREDDAGVPYAYYSAGTQVRNIENAARALGERWNRFRPRKVGDVRWAMTEGSRSFGRCA